MRETLSELLTLAEGAKILGVSRVSVWRYVKSGKLPSVEIGPHLFVRRADVDRLAAKGK